MCKRCVNEVSEMDIKDSDLPYLPFKMVKWHCIIPGCNHGSKVKDYGISPYYYWDVKKISDNTGWRGGWFDASWHYILCSRHHKEHKLIGKRAFIEKYSIMSNNNSEHRLSLIKTIPKK